MRSNHLNSSLPPRDRKTRTMPSRPRHGIFSNLMTETAGPSTTLPRHAGTGGMTDDPDGKFLYEDFGHFNRG
jgi:hypothetical protein